MAKEYNAKGLRASYPGIMLDTFDFLLPGVSDWVFDKLGISDAVDSVADADGGIVARLYNDITGKNAQQREFEQQEYLQDKMNAYNAPDAQMQRYMDAGFNRDLAAQAVLGGNAGESAQAPAVPSAAGAAAAGGAAIGQTATTAAQLPAMLEATRADANAKNAAAALDTANAAAVERGVKIKTLEASASLVKAFVGAGLPEIGAGLMAMDIVNGGPNRIVEYLQAFDGIRLVDQQIQALKDAHDLKLKEIARYDERIDAAIALDEKSALQAEKDAALKEAQADYQKQVNDLWKECPGYNLPGFNQLRIAQSKYGSDSPEYNAVGKCIMDASYQDSRGSFDADADTAWKRFKEQLEGSNFAKKQDAAFFAKIENSKELFKVVADLYLSPDGSLSSLGNRIISLLGADLHLDENELQNWIKDAYSSDVR